MILRQIILFSIVSYSRCCSAWFSLSLRTVRADVTRLATSVADWCSLTITCIGCWSGTNRVGGFQWCRPSWRSYCWFTTISFLVPVPLWNRACWLGPYPCGYRSRRYSSSVLYLRLTCTHVISDGVFDLRCSRNEINHMAELGGMSSREDFPTKRVV